MRVDPKPLPYFHEALTFAFELVLYQVERVFRPSITQPSGGISVDR